MENNSRSQLLTFTLAHLYYDKWINQMTTIFTGFDSAWGGRQKGAICDMELMESGGGHGLRICHRPRAVTWDDAVAEVNKTFATVNHHILAIDQGLVVPNATGQRPVERDIARALMRMYSCGAHSSNTGPKSCYTEKAGIWRYLRELRSNGYRQEPLAIPQSQNGRYYFECYPHPALIALFNLESVLQYKRHKRNEGAWCTLHELLGTLEESALPVVNMRDTLRILTDFTKTNEDAIDAIVAAYIAAYWWRFGTNRSVMLGDVETGYIVTPVNEPLRARYASVTELPLNRGGLGELPTIVDVPEIIADTSKVSSNLDRALSADALPCEGEEVQMVCNDTTNLWCKHNPWMRRSQCEGYQLTVHCLDVDEEPVLNFVPFANRGSSQGGMRISIDKDQRNVWRELTRGTKNDSLAVIRAKYCYRPLE